MKLSIFFLGLANLAVAARLDIRVPPSAALPNPGTLSSTTHAVLLGPTSVRYDAPLRRDTSFSFPSIQDASYLLTIHSRDHVFPPLRIDVSKSGEVSRVSAWQTFRGNEWSNKGPLFGNATDALAIDVRAIGRKVFYVERGGFNFLGFLKSPMILMGLFSVALIFGMPYIMNNMDEETKAEFEEMQRKSPMGGSDGAVNQLQNFDLAGWMAGKSTAGGSGSSSRSAKKK